MWERTVQPDRPTDTNIIQRMSFECWITMATNTGSEYVILVAFPRQQWLRERASKSRFNVPCFSPTTPVWADRDKLHVIREPPGRNQRYRPEKTIPCTPENFGHRHQYSYLVQITRVAAWGGAAPRVGAVGSDNAPQAGRSRVTGIFYSGRTMALGSTKKWVPGIFPGVVKAAGA
jgi:hypothetical protein